MKWSFLLFSSFLCFQAIAQYPATGNKMRLGWQTTGDGLVYRGAIGDTATLDPSGLNNAWMLLDTANGNLYAYRAKAWRLVSGGGGGGVTMPFDSVTFNVNETDASLRELKYSEEKGYLQYGGLDSVQIPLLPGIWYVRNDTSVTIPKGTVVRATGTLGASGRIKVKHMIANGSIDAMYVLGIAMQDIAVGADGYVMTQGKIRQVNTQAYSEGAVLYADVDTLGGLTQTEPTGSNLKLPIAFVVHSASNGTLAVRVSPGTYLRDLHDVYITSPASNASLYYNTSESVWRDTGAAVLVADTATMLTNYINVADTATMLTNYINVADTATMLSSYISNADTSVFARDFQISGTTNRLAMFTGANTVGNSNIYQDSVGKIGIGINPSYKFQMFFNNSVTGVQDTLMDLYSANWYPVGVRSRVSNQIANGSYAVIGEALNGHYQENVGVYGIATKSDISGPGVNIGLKGEVSGTYNALSTASGATYGGLFINNVRKTLSSGNFNIGLRVITDSAGTYGIYQNGFGANYFQGNVGINTTTPTAKLHINNPSSTTPALNIVSNSNVIGSTNDAVSINMQPGQVNQNNTGVRVFNTIPGTSAEGNNTGIAVSLNARNSSYGVYSAVSKNWGGSSLFGEAIGVYGSATTDSPAGFSYGGYFKNDTTQGTGFGVFIQTTTPKGSGTVTPLAIQHNSTELMRVQSSGNVGIGTASPTKKLSVNGETDIAAGSGGYFRVKDNIVDAHGIALNYNGIGTGVGLIANTFSTGGLALGGASTAEHMRISASGNVGIATSSPSRPLHVAGTTAIRIPVGTTSDRGTSANGDLRYSTTFNNIEFYDGSRGLWERPLVGTVANNKVAFASGDTLTSNTNFHWDNTNTRLGIGNATPDSTLTVTGGIRATTGVTAARFTATGSTVPTNGMYLPATNALAFSTNSTERMRILSDGKVGINVTPTEQLQVGGTVRATRLSVNTFKTEVVSINNFAPSGLPDGQGNNLWIGDGGQSSSWIAGGEGGGNLSIGRNALFANTRGSGNLAIGTSALASNTTGNVNIAIGAGSIANSTQEANSIAIGAFTLQNNNSTTGENIAIGFSAMSGSVGGRYNVGIGASTLSSNTGYEHVAIGRIALASNTSGIANTAIGYYSSAFNTTGSYNVAIGHEAGAKTNAGGFNETSYQSIYIGRDARASASGNGNEIVIGDQGRGNGSNTTTIGNSSTTKTFFQYGETYIGTATDNGAYNLQVAGGSYLSGEIKYVNRPAAAAVTNVGVDANGVLREATSSQRFKDNITPYQKGLSDAMRLQAKTYTYKGDTTLQAGFIAEDVHEAGLTEYVNYDKEGRPYSLQYGNMVTLLLNAMKEQQAQIEALKKEIEALKNK